MKTCRGCLAEKPLSEFSAYRSSKDGLQARCKDCNAAYYQVHRKVQGRAARKARYQERTSFLNAYKSGPCADCGGSYPPCVMDFDHLPQYEKAFALGAWTGSGPLTARAKSQALAEIAKCEVVCANCHRLRTFRRRQARHGSVQS